MNLPECPSCDDSWAAHVAGMHEETDAGRVVVPEARLIVDFIGRLDALQDCTERLPSHGRNDLGADLVSRSDVLAEIGHTRAEGGHNHR